MEGGWSHDKNYNNNLSFNTYMMSVAVGTRIALFEGRGKLPQVSFRTDVSLPIRRYGEDDDFSTEKLQPSVELEFRNRFGERWSVDYTLGYSWHQYGYETFDNGIYYALSANYLATDRLMVGMSFSLQRVRGLDNGQFHLIEPQGLHNHYMNLTALYQATPRLQLSLQGSVQAGAALFESWNYVRFASDLRIGLHWFIGRRR